MPAIEKCSQCLHVFSLSQLPRKLPNCPHSICEPCLREITESTQEMLICGFCSSVLRREELKVLPVSAPLLLLADVQPPREATPSEEENQLLSDFTVENSGEQLCPAHKVVMDIVCITDKHRICPHCALFGNHRDHRFKRLQDFELEVQEKKDEFAKIRNQKGLLMTAQDTHIYETMRDKIATKRQQLLSEVEDQTTRLINAIKQAKKRSVDQVYQVCGELQKNFTAVGALKFEKSKSKIAKWEQCCLSAMQLLDHTPNVQHRLISYYDGPLEIVTEGLVFLEELTSHAREAIQNLDQQLSEVQLIKQDPQEVTAKCFTLNKAVISPNETMQSSEEEPSEANPFMDCTASEISPGNLSPLNSTSLQAEFAAISKQVQKKPSRNNTPKRQSSGHMVSVENDKLKCLVASKLNGQNITKLPTAAALKRTSSELTNPKTSPKLLKCSESIPEAETRVHEPKEVREAEKIYQAFCKSSLCDFLDLSECGLASEAVVEYVHRARRVHKIRGLKLCGNALTAAGFERMAEFLQGVSNINAANNAITDPIFDVLLRHRDKLEALKILNLSHNPIALDKKAAARLEELKRTGLILVL